MRKSLAAQLQGLDFDHPFTIDVNGDVQDVPNEWAPNVCHSETDDIEIDDPAWEGAIEGCTGQYSYTGHVMHSSEFIGGSLARYIIDTNDAGTVFAIVAVEVTPDDEDEEPEPAGWTIVRKNGA